MSFSSRIVPIALCGYILVTPITGADASTPADTADVQHLMEEYHSAIVAHDGVHLAKLFAPTGTAWFNVLSDQGYSRAQATTPDAPKVRPGSVESFVSFVATSKAALDPQHGPVHIQTDGSIASVYFDFHFMMDGKVQNVGSESWQLVKLADGWRIASIVYSSTPTPR